MKGQANARCQEAIAVFAVVGMFAVAAAGSAAARTLAPRPTPDRCATMLDRYAEQQARAYERPPSAAIKPQSLSAPDVLRCTRELTDSEVECALTAGYVDALERCLP